jgi:hypothetical protein
VVDSVQIFLFRQRLENLLNPMPRFLVFLQSVSTCCAYQKGVQSPVVQRLLAIPLLLLVMIWPVETAIATTVMSSSHSCCVPKPAAHHCHSAEGATASARHSHGQCPMDCCSKRQASGSAVATNPTALRLFVVELQQVVIRSFEAHSVLATRSDRERGPPFLS